LSHPVSTAIVGVSAIPHLEENVRAATAFEPLGDKAMAEIRAAALG
jgi:aryl-alcohol dehydrogenase-like predicted oxidoreductase